MSGAEPPVPLRTITERAAAQAELLKESFGLTGDRELADLSTIKLQEEIGEIAEAYLACKGQQRPEKLAAAGGATPDELLALLGDEIADATVVLAILAHAVGLSFHDIVADRLDHLAARSAPGAELPELPDTTVSTADPSGTSLFAPDLVARTPKLSRAAALAAAEAERRDARTDDRRPSPTAMPHEADGWSQLDLFS
jgi:hypothetical protein